MRWISVGPALALALALSGGAMADDWVAVATDADQTEFALDPNSVKPDGAYVYSWVRANLGRSRRDPEGKPYRSALMRRLDNCRDQTTAVISTVYADEQGRTVSSTTTPQGQWTFVPAPPGSVDEALQTRICAMAARRAGLKPAIKLEPSTTGEWRSVAYDPERNRDFSFAPRSIARLQSGQIALVSRMSPRTPQRLGDGTEFSVAFTLEVFDCIMASYAEAAHDAYDSHGQLVATDSTPTDKLRFKPVLPSTAADRTMKVACPLANAGAPPAGGPVPGGAAATKSGTGWMTSKGYVVTAAHVVSDGRAIVLAQNGKPVGSAEVVLADPANDIAILKPKFTDGPHPFIRLEEGLARLGEKVFTLGYPAPGQMGLAVKMTSGDVNALAGNDVASGRKDDARLIQISIPVESGNSGGPVIDSGGRAIGIILSKMSLVSGREVAENVNYAIRIAYVRDLLAGLPDIGGYEPAKPGPTRVAEVEQLQSAVFLVLVQVGTPSTAH